MRRCGIAKKLVEDVKTETKWRDNDQKRKVLKKRKRKSKQWSKKNPTYFVFDVANFLWIGRKK